MAYYDYEYDNRQPSGIKWVFLVIAILSIISFIVLSSCSPVKRMGGLAAKHPDAARKMCIQMFPVDVKTVTKTEYLPGIPVVSYDTVSIDCDSVIAKNARNNQTDKKDHIAQPGRMLVKLPCPPSTHQTDTIVVTDSIVIENTAKIDALTKDLADCKTDADRLRNSLKWWRYIALACFGIIGITAALKFLTGRAKKIKDKLS